MFNLLTEITDYLLLSKSKIYSENFNDLFYDFKKDLYLEYKLCTRFCKVKSVSFIEILLKRLNDLKNNDVLLSSDI